MRRAAGLVLRVAVRDYLHEFRLSLCAIAALTAVLTPLLVLFGLKYGIVTSMLDDLRRSPQTRLVQPLGQGQYDSAWLEQLRASTGVEFLIPTTRYLSATIELGQNESQRTPLQRAEMWPTESGDPLWSGAVPTFHADVVQVVLAPALAQRLGAGPGDELQARIGRTTRSGDRQGVRIRVQVIGLLQAHHVQRDVLLVPLGFLEAVEAYREGYAVPSLAWNGEAADPTATRVFASFRLYADDLDAVGALQTQLLAQGIDTDTAASQIELVRKLERALNLLFLILSGLASVGYALSLTLNLLATVTRKQQDLSVLKMLGFGNGAVALFPVYQAVLTAVLGCAAAIGLYAGAAPLINYLFADGLRAGQVVCVLLPSHLAVAVAATLALAVVTALASGIRAAALQPAEGLRHE